MMIVTKQKQQGKTVVLMDSTEVKFYSWFETEFPACQELQGQI